MSFDSPRSRRVAAVTALGLFWGTLLLAVGVPALAIGTAALLIGASLLVACCGRQGAHLVGGALKRVGDWTARDARQVATRGMSGARAGVRRAAGEALHVSRASRTAFAALDARRRVHDAAALIVAVVAQIGGVRNAVRSKPDPRIEAWRLNQMSADLRGQGRTAEALERSEAALALFRQLDDRRGQALTLNSMGLALARRDDTTNAIVRFEEALELLAWLGDRHGEGQVMANLGALNQRQGREEEARAYWRDALARLDPDSPERERIAEQLRLAS
jgi:tetratricopeptide (TPR) repeat protein